MSVGKLFVVPTPIGNLEDMTMRAIRVLKEAELILCEDTRTSSVLLKHYEISKPLQSHHAHNEHNKIDYLTQKMEQGAVFALISDAGTPGISDPGFLLIRECLRKKIPVECLPGATAFVPALVKSGLPSDSFIFEGFLPVKKGRQTQLKRLAGEERTIIFYESPFRVVRTLEDLIEHIGKHRMISVSREISKKFEETFTLTLEEALVHFKTKEPKGEFVMVLAGLDKKAAKQKHLEDE
jgi:16S rRNA (cytidine1402-2'-O)-methyltransferase